jgi:hypothetical protein
LAAGIVGRQPLLQARVVRVLCEDALKVLASLGLLSLRDVILSPLGESEVTDRRSPRASTQRLLERVAGGVVEALLLGGRGIQRSPVVET